MDERVAVGEQLLASWLHLSSTIWNTRLVSSLTFNETHILGLILQNEGSGELLTATDLIARTRLLKSQMNKILGELENKGYILRSRYEGDRRKVSIALTDAGKAAYLAEHERVQELLGRVIEQLGIQRTSKLSSEIEHITNVIEQLLSEKI